MDHEEDQPNEEEQARESGNAHDKACGESREAFDELGDAFRRAWKAGASDARNAARQAVPRAREEFSRGFHDLAWGAAYLVGFGTSLAREFAPDCMNEGWDDGARAGKQVGVKVAEQCRRPEKEESEPAATDGDPGSDPEVSPA